MDNTEKAEKHLEIMNILRNGGTIECPFCNKGKVRALNEAVFSCDYCGRGMIGRKPLIK